MGNSNLPNLIIAGVNKAGTTSIFTYLGMHPEICISKKKETCYFLPIRYGEQLAPLNDYKNYFSHCTGQRYIIESTPGYFYGSLETAQSIKNRLGSIKILIILREPIDRLYSFFTSQKSRLALEKDVTFSEYIKRCENLNHDKLFQKKYNTYTGLWGGIYSECIDAWFDTFGDENVTVFFFDDLIADTRALLKRICQWLNIDSTLYNTFQFTVENKTVDYSNKALHKIARSINKQFEPLFRKYPFLKQKIRKEYFKINTKNFDKKIEEKERVYLTNFYKNSNKSLFLKLNEKGYRKLPNWLVNSVN